MANTNSGNFVRASSQYLSVENTNLAIGTNSASLECWFKTTNVNHQVFVSIGHSSGSTANNFYIRKLGDGRILGDLVFNNGGTQNIQIFSSAATYADGEWHHASVVIWNDGVANIELFIDGTSQGTTSHGSLEYNLPTAMSQLLVGVDRNFVSGTLEHFTDGEIDEVRHWVGTQRTRTEIAASMFDELIGTETNLQGYWKLNGDTNDTTANANNLTNNNSVTFTTDVPFLDDGTEKSMIVDGVSEYWLAPDSDNLDIISSITLEVLIKPNSPSTNTAVLSKGHNTSAADRPINYSIDWGTGGALRFVYTESNNFHVYTLGTAISATDWTHVAFTYTFGTGSTAKFFVNGVETAGSWTLLDGNTAPAVNTDAVYIGAQLISGVGFNFFNGQFDYMRIWNTTRTPAEILANKCTQLTTATNLVGNWNFSGTNLDESGNGNHLSPVNVPTFSTVSPVADDQIAGVCFVAIPAAERIIFN